MCVSMSPHVPFKTFLIYTIRIDHVVSFRNNYYQSCRQIVRGKS